MKIDATETKLTLAGLRIAESKLAKVAASLDKKCTADEAKRRARLSPYSYDEAQEAYGYGDITLDELRAIEDGLNDTPVTKYTIALLAIRSCLGDIRTETKELEWDLLSQSDKDRIAAEREEMQARIAEKKGLIING